MLSNTMPDFEKFDAPELKFSDLPDGMGEKVRVGDVITATKGAEKEHADVIEVDPTGECIYLSKELPAGWDLSVDEKSTGSQAPYEAMQKEAQIDSPKKDKAPSKDDLMGPLPKLKNILIQISIEE